MLFSVYVNFFKKILLIKRLTTRAICGKIKMYKYFIEQAHACKGENYEEKVTFLGDYDNRSYVRACNYC